MTQEFYVSVTPVGGGTYLVRTERVSPGVPLAEEQVTWPVEDWLAQAGQLMHDPLLGLLRGNGVAATWNSRSTSSSTPTGGRSPLSLIRLGQGLYEALFYQSIRDSFMTAQGIAQHRREVLRLRLGLKGDVLPRLPWEVLHAKDRPLATGTDVIFSRYQSAFAPMAAVLQPHTSFYPNQHQTLRILMVLAAPTDQDVLQLKREALHLQEELHGDRSQDGANIQVTILEQPGREQLTQALEQGQYQVFHYAGHSNLGEAGGDVYLVSDKTGLTEVLSGDDLAGLLVNNGIRMAVFNSCRGVYTATADPQTNPATGNLAEALLKRGIPAVLAMAERIPDEVALTLSRLFYRNLKRIYPIDLSLNRARQGLISAYGSHQLYWALPILYLHPDFNGYLQVPPHKPGERDDNLVDRLNRAEARENSLPAAVEIDPIELDQWMNQLDAAEAEADNASVASLLQELTHPPGDQEDPITPAPEGENLLPDAGGSLQNYLDELPHIPATVSGADVWRTGTQQSLPPNLLNDYNALGQILYQQGDLTGAVAAYRRAIQQQPQLAEAYNNLALVLYKQGKLQDAVAVYHRAAEVNPQMAEVYQNLERLLLAESKLAETPVSPEPSPVQPPTPAVEPVPVQPIATVATEQPLPEVSIPSADRPQPSRRWPQVDRRFWFIPAGIGLLCGGGLLVTQLNRQPRPGELLPPSPTSSSTSPGSNKTESQRLRDSALKSFNQKDLQAGTKAVTELLDKKGISDAAVALRAVPSKDVGNPRVSFLNGRLAWQSMKAGDPSGIYKWEDALRFWDTAVKGDKTNLAYRVALGFAFYQQNRLDEAQDAWIETVKLYRNQATPAPTPPAEALTAYAGLALVSQKKLEQRPPEQKAELTKEMLKLRDTVLEGDRPGFQPTALAQNWLWTEATIKEWQTLLERKDTQ